MSLLIQKLVIKLTFVSRLTLVGHKAKKKQHAHASLSLCDHYSELFTHSRTLKLVNTVTKLP